MSSNHIQLFSPFSPAECVARLKTAINAPGPKFLSLESLGSGQSISGRVTGSSIKLYRRVIPLGYSRVPAILKAQIRPTDGGTIISGRFVVAPFYFIYKTVWCLGVGILLLAAITHLLPLQEPSGRWAAILFLFIMLAFGISSLLFSRLSMRPECRVLTDCIIPILNAQEQNLPHLETNA